MEYIGILKKALELPSESRGRFFGKRVAVSSIASQAKEIESVLISERRAFHEYAEPGWCEVRTSAHIASVLAALGFDVAVGRDVLSAEREGLPSEDVLEEARRAALFSGAEEKFVEMVSRGHTAVVGTLRSDVSGPVVALRFDIDANYGDEATGDDHAPAAIGFRSTTAGAMHSCGHDAHAAIGLGVARIIAASRSQFRGEIRLVFQPAEEGLRGGNAMVRAGVMEGVDYVLGCHIGVQARNTGEIIAGYNKILASKKLDISFTGRNAHAGISPHEGRNAIQAAAVAVQNLLAISRHGDGETRINIGRISGGQTRNSIPATATLQLEIRADTSDILTYLDQEVRAVLNGAASICGVSVGIESVGGAGGASSDAELTAVVEKVANDNRRVHLVRRSSDFKGSDDMSSFMTAVQEQGGKAVYFGLGSDLPDFHHAPHFDIDESSLITGVEVFIGCLRELGACD